MTNETTSSPKVTEHKSAKKQVFTAVWTSVADVLPGKNVACLVYWGESFGSPLIGVAQRCVPYDGSLHWLGHGGSHNSVTHWMALPERPAGSRS